jgi:hypothetical protein
MATTARRLATEEDLLAVPDDRPRYVLDKVGEYL